jgi:hypothetical protein
MMSTTGDELKQFTVSRSSAHKLSVSRESVILTCRFTGYEPKTLYDILREFLREDFDRKVESVCC